jgi:hypothetical protein
MSRPNDDDPFLPPRDPSLIIAPAVPRREQTPPSERYSSEEASLRARRKPLRYKAPRTSWPLFGLLLLAGFGLANLGRIVVPKLREMVLGLDARRPKPPPEPTVYRALELGDAVLIDIAVVPKSAWLTLDGGPLPSNPVRLPRGPRTYKVAAFAVGYETGATTFVADTSKSVSIKLKREGKPDRRSR